MDDSTTNNKPKQMMTVLCDGPHFLKFWSTSISNAAQGISIARFVTRFPQLYNRCEKKGPPYSLEHQVLVGVMQMVFL